MTILAGFPIEVINAVADPARGLPMRKSRPELCDIRAACDEAYEPVGNRYRREKIAAEQRARIASEVRADQRPPPEVIKTKLKDFPGEPVDGDLKAHKRDDPTEAEQQTSLDAVECAKTDRTILREYAQRNQDPVYAAPGMLVSPSLVKLIKATRGTP
jgi:hypothetical protein